ncbi:MAG: hypothetical protein BGO55_06755 [Sphingobacteriales bacterium 50-39]|nr:hypothetical protein [Sphingobacteriales bacterium]OJW52953.1 MAG: hypothetical protein BGO55_06755 [Sphingobacteriales bacterium 50-39]
MKVIVIGGNFAGFTASIQIKRKLGKEADVLVIDRNPDLLFMPSLIWVPTGRREVKNITIYAYPGETGSIQTKPRSYRYRCDPAGGVHGGRL